MTIKIRWLTNAVFSPSAQPNPLPQRHRDWSCTSLTSLSPHQCCKCCSLLPYSSTSLSFIPVWTFNPPSSEPLLSPLRTHSPEWMLMVVPTRLLFLCLFSHRKSRALRAWACENWRKVGSLIKKKSQNRSTLAVLCSNDYGDWLCAYSVVWCCQKMIQFQFKSDKLTQQKMFLKKSFSK